MRCRYRHLHPKLVGLARLAFVDALHFRRMQGVEFVAVLGLLFEQTLDLVQQVCNRQLEVLRHLIQLARCVTSDTSDQRLELL